MRLFFDANIITYMAIFEEYLIEGSPSAYVEECELWRRLQGSDLNAQLEREIRSLRILYQIDDQARFDWLCSDRGIDEIMRIRNAAKRSTHFSLLERMVEHRRDVYDEEGGAISEEAIAAQFERSFRTLPPAMHSDALQFAEAEIVGSDYFLTNDGPFIRQASTVASECRACRPSELPFVRPHLNAAITDSEQ